MKFKIVETCEYVVDAPDQEAAEAKFLDSMQLPAVQQHGTLAVEFHGVTEREILRDES